MNRAAFTILLLAFLWAPFSGFFDSTWSNLLVCLLPLFALLLVILERWEEPAWIRIPPGFNALFLLILLGLVQLIPLPSPLTRIISPNSWEIYQETVGVLQEGAWVPLTLDPKATLSALFRLIGCWAGYIAAANLLAERNRLKVSAAFLVALGGGLAVCILALWGLNAVFGFFPSTDGASSTFSLLHTALVTTFLVIVCPLSLALFLVERPTVRYGTFQERLKDFFPTLYQKRHFIYGLPALAIPFALVPQWPGGLQVLLFAVLVFLILLGLRSRGRRELSYLFGYLLLVLILAVSVLQTGNSQKNTETVATLVAEPEREKIVSSQLLSDFFLVGSGYGSFPAISKRYELISPGGSLKDLAGHSIIRLMSQGGLIGLAAMGWFLTTFTYGTFRHWWNRRQKLTVYLYPAATGGGIAFLFSYFSRGGVGLEGAFLLAFLLLGLVAASVNPSTYPLQDEEPFQLGKPVTVFVTIASVFFTAFFYLGELAGKSFYNDARDLVSETPQVREQSRELMARASFFDPFNGRYRYAQGYQAMARNDDSLAQQHFIDGVRLAPLDSRALYGLGQFFFAAGNPGISQKLLLAALKNDPFSREIQSAYVDQLLKTEQFKEALAFIRQFLDVSPEDTLFWIQNLTNLGVSEGLQPTILPDRSRSYHDYGLYLLKRGDAVKADQFFRKALGFARQEKYPDKSIFLSMVGFFERHQSFDQALDTLLVARQKYPDETDFLLASGRVYEEMGLTFKAREIYQEVLIIDPGNEGARQRMEILEGIF